MLRNSLSIFLLLLTPALSYSQTDDGRSITIPVVFHVIYTDSLPDNGMGDEVRNSKFGNSTTKVPREKILAELKDLDLDFQLLNADKEDVIAEYKAVIGNPKIHFVLKDILYVSATPDQIKARNNAPLFRELSKMQDPENCLNVYISTLTVSGGGSEGVTNVPGPNVDLANDGVNLNY